MILVYDMSSSERLDAVPGEAMVEPHSGENVTPAVVEPQVLPALSEVASEPVEVGGARPIVFDVERLLDQMT